MNEANMKKYKRVYIAGSYSADNVLDVLDNIRIGMRAATVLFLKGYAPFCPWHDHMFQFQLRGNEKLTIKDYYEYSLSWLDVSDIMAVLPNSKKSKGTQAEIKRARELQIPIVYLDEKFLQE